MVLAEKMTDFYARIAAKSVLRAFFRKNVILAEESDDFFARISFYASPAI